MRIRSGLSKPLASLIAKQQKKWALAPEKYQNKIFDQLIKNGAKTLFGQDHNFKDIANYEEFKLRVPVRDYEELKPYIDKIIVGQKDVLWPGMPAYFAKTSGTTSGTKYIPITSDSVPNHINSARNALLNYVHESGQAKFLDGKLIFLSGSPHWNQQVA